MGGRGRARASERGCQQLIVFITGSESCEIGRDEGGETHALPVDRIIRRLRIALDPADEPVKLLWRDKELEVGLLVDVAVFRGAPAVDLVRGGGTVDT